MEIVRYNDSLKTEWERVVTQSKNGNFLHLRDYMEYHIDRFEDQSIMIFSHGKPVAVFPCNKEKELIVSHAGLTYGGLLFGKDVHASDILKIFFDITNYYKLIGAKRILYKSIPHVYHKYPAEEDLYALFCMNSCLYRRDISSVIEISERPKFSDSRKNTARKSEKSGVTLSEQTDFYEFHLLVSNTLSKYGCSPVHTIAELNLLKGRFPSKIRVFSALLGEELLATTLIYDFGHIVHTQYLASSEHGRVLGALDYLLIQLIEKVFFNKKYLSFGISTEEQGRYLNEGLIRQKEGFGGRGIVHDFYQWML